ncbi:hypothetical protein NKR74_13240 [Bacillus sp. 3103sda1]|uniref:hypothetical protein n=1 Tax=Bacillus sp. 3103sda1 TaxID=2953808 RepID=UPI0020A1C596|nr:hypothetical protein [Bacillus sp. 3103sda1]MCP1124263.1 hypothetical protein [Bacillus sp. 3103sda1]
MCLILTIGTNIKIPELTIKNFEENNIFIEEVKEGTPTRLFSTKYKHIYSLTNGMCSCDFFERSSNIQKVSEYMPKLSSLINDLEKKLIRICLHVHSYVGFYETERLPSPNKVIINKEKLLEDFSFLEEDVVYVVNN